MSRDFDALMRRQRRRTDILRRSVSPSPRLSAWLQTPQHGGEKALARIGPGHATFARWMALVPRELRSLKLVNRAMEPYSSVLWESEATVRSLRRGGTMASRMAKEWRGLCGPVGGFARCSQCSA